MSVLSELLVRIGSDTKGLSDGFSRLNAELRTAGNNAQRNLAGFQSAAASITNVGQSLTMGLTLPLVAGGAAALAAAGKLEQASTAFRTMTGSAAQAEKQLSALRAFALKTPFQFTELVDASRRMQALGFSANEVIPILTKVGNATSALGLGAEGLNRIILALGQMKAKGTVQAEEMRQLAEAGIPAWDALAKKLNVDVATAMKLVEKRAVDASLGIDAVLGVMDTKFMGGMEAQSKTLLGLVSNLKDAMFFAASDIGKVLLPTAKRVISEFILPTLNGLVSLAKGFSDLPPYMQNASIALGVFTASAPVAIWLLGSMATNIMAVLTALTKLQAAGALAFLGKLAVALAVVYGTYKLIEKATDKASELGTQFGGLDTPVPMYLQDRAAKVDDLTAQLEELNAVQRKVSAEKGFDLRASLIDPMGQAEAQAKSLAESIKRAFSGAADTTPFVKTAKNFFDPMISIAVEEEKRRQRELRNEIIESTEAFRNWGAVTAGSVRPLTENQQALKATLEALDPTTEGMMAMARAHQRLSDIQGPMNVGLDESSRKVRELGEAMKTLGVDRNRFDFSQLDAALNTINEGFERGAVSAETLDAAVRNYLKDWLAMIDAMKAAGEKIDPAILKEAEKVRVGISSGRKEINEFERETRRAFDHMSRQIAKSIVEWKGFGEALKSVAKSFAEGILEIVIQKFLEPFKLALSKIIGTLFDKLAGLFGGSSWSGVFGGGGNAGGIMNAVGTGVGSASSGIASSMAGGGLLSSILGGVTAAAGVASVVQGVRQEGTLNAIEHNTRYGEIHLLNILEKLNEYIPKVKDLWDYAWNVQKPYLAEMNTSLLDLKNRGFSASGGGGGTTFSFNNCNFGGATQSTIESWMNLAIQRARTSGALA